MQQLILEMIPAPPASFDNFITGANSELTDTLKAMVYGAESSCQLYFWGVPASGKTHLLKAAVVAAQNLGKSAAYFTAAGFAKADDVDFELLAVDETDQLNDTTQVKLFNTINKIREGKGILVCAGSAAPMSLPLRIDLTTRLGWELVYQIHPLNDADKLAALTRFAQARGFDLQLEVLDYLMRHWRRDLPSLIFALERLDHHSLQTKRAITIPLLRQILAQSI